MIYLTALLASMQILSVGGNGRFSTIGEALRAAEKGDTIVVAAGTYHEHLAITRPTILLGTRGAVLDGDGTGSVVIVTAPRTTVRGFIIQGSGRSQAQEHAGLLAEKADDLVVEDNEFRDVLFGIYVKESRRPRLERNTIEGKDIDTPLRGDGIRLWYSHDGAIIGNRVNRSRDVVIWFSDRTMVRGNEVRDSRYGLHYMYSNFNVFEQNRFAGNDVGAFLMYSSDVTFRDNVFAGAKGTSGRGLGFKDSDRITAEDNTLVMNAVGISIDNSPTTMGEVNHFRNNTMAFNDIAITMLPSVRSNIFTGNAFLGNGRPVRVTGGGDALSNIWANNYWTDYAGFDANADGRGDTPFVYQRLADDVLDKYPALMVFALSPAFELLNTVGRAFPALAPRAIVIDSSPRIRHIRATQPPAPRRPGRTAGVTACLAAALLAAISIQGIRRPSRGLPR